MRAILFGLFIFGLLSAAVVDVGGGSGSHQVIVKTGEKVTVVNVSESQPSLGLVNEKGEEIVMGDGKGMPSNAQVQSTNRNMVMVREQNRVYVSDASTQAEVRTNLEYKEQALVSTQSGKEIKVAPSVAVEAIPAKAGIKSISVVDDGKSPAYEVTAVSTGNLFFVLPVQMEIKYRIDATDGKVISEEKPWWSFLVWS
ncbi:MAG: hypothetical protein QXY05_03760 [Candidatus Anstonellales archaeon]